MGRGNYLPEDLKAPIKLQLEYVPFVDGCYDRWGAYWGSPANLHCAWNNEGDEPVRVFVRAYDRGKAKDLIREILPNAKFYR